MALAPAPSPHDQLWRWKIAEWITEASSSVAGTGFVKKSGDTMTGSLTLTTGSITLTAGNINAGGGMFIGATAAAVLGNGSGAGTVYLRPNGYVSSTGEVQLTSAGTLLPAANGTQNLGGPSNRWATIYTGDLSLKNDVGDWLIVEGEHDLFITNNKTGKRYKFHLIPVDDD